ncbi:MAG TPA: hypothetical protein PLH93_03490 [Flavobacteriales bacterium]|nr:hypothetical protein [Flavobacteriales bacterium]
MEPKTRTIVQAALIVMIIAAIVITRRPGERPVPDPEAQATAMNR